MAVERDEDVPDVDHFDRPDLELSPETHQVQAEMAAERGEEYDPHEFEESLDDQPNPHPIKDAEPVEDQEERFNEWRESDE